MTATRRPFARSLVELAAIVLAALGFALAIEAFLVKPYQIPSGSMLPTLHINQRVLVDRLASDFSSPQIGDIIVFHPPDDYGSCANPNQGVVGGAGAMACDVTQSRPAAVTFIKRVVGLPGDHLSIVGGHVIRNGQREPDPYIKACGDAAGCSFPREIVVPPGDYYVMGDNRPDSQDSRYWGPVPKAWIIGKAFFTYWPPDRVGFL